jgi:pimeloyl-ACP methyl ester carboxylesterase
MRPHRTGSLFVALILMFVGYRVMAQDTAVETGQIDGAPYRIMVPTRWNGGMVVYAHGYLPRGATWTPLNEIFTAVFLDRGFALVESGYSSQGWAVREGIRETEALRRHFVELHGEPDVAFVTGHSMGGLIALATIETYPELYDGALPMCGPLVGAPLFYRDSVLDMLLTFEALFGKSLQEELLPVIEAPGLPKEAVEQALEADSVLAERFSLHWDVKREELAGIVSLYHLLCREVMDRSGGNPVDNLNTVYSGFGDIEGLNNEIGRYAADPEAFAYLRENYTPTGIILDPVLAVHTTYDPGVPPRWSNSYSMTLRLTGHDDWFVQKWVEADGHCNIDPVLIAIAFDELQTWVRDGVKPQPGLLRP